MSNAAASTTPGERDNALRFRAGQARGHVESHFLKANSPDGLRAFWIKHTVLSPAAAHGQQVAEVWAIAFERDSLTGPVRKAALKRTFPLASAALSDAPFCFSVGGSELRHGRARALLPAQAGDAGADWDLQYRCPEAAFRPFPRPSMYTGAFPRSKSLTPVPQAKARGHFQLGALRWDVDGYWLAQGHNWGQSHAASYAWAQINAFEGAPDAWFEALTGKVRVGPLTTPWMSVAALYLDGELHRFDGLRAMLASEARIDQRSYALTARTGRAELRLTISAEAHAFAGLRYQDPDGRTLDCLNSKLAGGEVSLTVHGRTRTLRTSMGALELGTREPGHGITMLV
ncbi:MAG: hypothetical protein RL385_2458 [Pseudomonadota bacterium]|jgi:hypothetical protein